MGSMGSDDPMADLNLVVELGFALGSHGNDPMEKKKLRPVDTTMAISVSVVAIITSLHLIAFVFAVGAERRRSTAKVLPDQYDEKTYCVYATDASTVYGLTAFGLLLLSQSVLKSIHSGKTCGAFCVRFLNLGVICCSNGWVKPHAKYVRSLHPRHR